MAFHAHGDGVFIDRLEEEFALRNFNRFLVSDTTTLRDPPRNAETHTEWNLVRPEWQTEPSGVIRVTHARGRIRLTRTSTDPMQWVCWVYRGSLHDQHLLAHEQGHYHISYVVLLQLLRTIKDFNFLPRDLPALSTHPTQAERDAVGDAILQRFEPIRSTAVRCLAEIDGVYDKETNHGTKLHAQAMWQQRLAAGLHGQFHPAIHFGTYYPGASSLPAVNAQ